MLEERTLLSAATDPPAGEQFQPFCVEDWYVPVVLAISGPVVGVEEAGVAEVSLVAETILGQDAGLSAWPVWYDTVAGSADSGIDFQPVSGTFVVNGPEDGAGQSDGFQGQTLPDGRLQATITIPLIDDDQPEGQEEF